MTALFYICLTIITFFTMEFVAWAMHKYVMHGFLWIWHEDHHIPGKTFFEKNDYFFLLFAVPSFFLFLFGTMGGINFLFFIGLGIFIYGLAYFFVHDIFIHQRFNILKKTKHPYLLAIRRAHKMHHKHIQKEDGECFGMLLVPWKYYRDAIREQKRLQQSYQ